MLFPKSKTNSQLRVSFFNYLFWTH